MQRVCAIFFISTIQRGGYIFQETNREPISLIYATIKTMPASMQGEAFLHLSNKNNEFGRYV